MSVYVDPLFDWPADAVRDPQARRLTEKYGQWSHLMADTQAELIAFALGKLGMRLGWIQKMNTPDVHFDLVPTKRAKAVRAGAIELTREQFRDLRQCLRSGEPYIPPTPQAEPPPLHFSEPRQSTLL